MLRSETCGQPAMGRVVDLLHAALADRRYDALDAAVAYTTASGVGALREGHAADLDRVSGRWLSSFDWCRSDPIALDALDQLTRSSVSIFDGRFVIGRPGCVPKLPFHPKGFLFSGPNVRLLISGSGNLSRNGLTRGIELDTLIEVRDPTTNEEISAWNAIEVIRTWFDDVWKTADPYGSLSDPYRVAYAKVLSSPPPTDDDWSDSRLIGSAQRYSAKDLLKMRRAPVFWIEAGNLTQNLGKGNPGNQLMMRALTRVFFGFEGTDRPKQTSIGTIDIRYEGTITPGLTLEFAHNGMDRLNLPKPGSGGPVKYDQETLILARIPYRGQVIYDLRLASSAEQRRLRRESRGAGLAFAMPGLGRRFGFCQG